MVIVRLSSLLLYFVLIINATKINQNEEYAPHIQAVLKYLNSNPNKIYNYNEGLFVNAQQKADIVELTLDVDVKCTTDHLEVPCTDQVLTCSGFLQQDVGGVDFKVLSNVACKPKRDFSFESFVEPSTISTPFPQESEIELSHEAVSTEGHADFVAVKADFVPCLGCPFDLNTNAEGVSALVDTALRHIETEKNVKHTAVKIIRVQQQVVAGVKYILLIEIAPTICQKGSANSCCPLDTTASSSTCEVIFLQKPWISKSKSIIKNNCTLSQYYNIDEEKSNTMDNKANRDKHFFGTYTDTQAITESNNVDPNYLADLESQIVNVEPMDDRAASKFNTDYKPFSTFNSNQDVYKKKLKTVNNENDSNDVLQVDHFTANENKLEGNSFVSEAVDDPKNESGGFFSEIVPENRPVLLEDAPRRSDRVLENASSNSLESTANDSQNSPLPTVENNSSEISDVYPVTLSSSDGSFSTSKSNLENSSPIETIVRFKRSYNRDENKSSSSSSSSSSSEKTTEKNEAKDDANRDNSNSSSSSDSKHQADKKKRNKSNSSSSSSSSSSSNESLEDVKKVKRSIGQLEKISQDEKLLVKDLADFATSRLDSIDDDNHKRVILQILGAKKLKLDGIYYQIILRLGISQCLEHVEDENCGKDLLTDLTKICKVGVHVEDDFSNPKLIKSQCQNIKKDENDKNRTNYSRYRRNVLVGGTSEISLDDPRILEFTKDTLSELDSKSDLPNRHKIVNIILATSQVVSGTKYHIKAKISLSDCLKNDSQLLENCEFLQNAMVKLCDIVVWEQLWLNKRDTTVTCDDGDKEYSFEYAIRNKKSVPSEIDLVDEDSKNKEENMILGGIEEETLDNVQALEYLKSILNHLDMESGHTNKLKIQHILSIRKQVVAGQLWRIKAELTLSECLKSDPIDSQKCDQLKGSDSLTCIFKIWDRPWLPYGREVETTCGNDSKSQKFRLKRNVGVSAYINSDSLYLGTNDEFTSKILDYLKIGLDYLDLKSTYETKYIVKKVTEVSKQAGAVQLWKISAEIVLSDCSKHYYSHYCDELHDSKSKKCIFKIWEQPRLLNSLQINITCDNDTNIYLFKKQDTSDSESKEILSKFKNFMLQHNKTYSNHIEYNYRLKVFKDNLNTIKLLNKYEQGTGKYGVTKFADLTADEFSKSHGLRMDLRNENDIPFMTAPIPNITLPTEFDWRKKSAVTEVKNQGSCGSCWAFSTTGNIEGQYAIKHGKLVEFSEQELVDCDKLDEGCNGGLMDNAYRTIEKLGGLESESDYPYDAADEKCHFDKTKVRVQVTGALNITHDENDMAKWLVENGPISIAINANAMQFYVGGVSHPWKILCNPKSLDHGVLIVGFGIHTYPLFNKTLPYWTIKNSWGPSWGEQGYYRVYRGDGTCGLNQTPSSAIVA